PRALHSFPTRRSSDLFGDDGAGAYLRRVARNLWLKRAGRRSASVDLDTAERAFAWFRRDDDGTGALEALRECLDTLSASARRARAEEHTSELQSLTNL